MKLPIYILAAFTTGALNAATLGTQHLGIEAGYSSYNYDSFRYIDENFDYRLDSDLWLATTEVSYNLPFATRNSVGFDFTANIFAATGKYKETAYGVYTDGYDYYPIDESADGTATQYGALLGTTVYGKGDSITPYLGLEMGLLRWKLAGEKSTDFIWRGTMGLEWDLTDSFTLQPRARVMGSDGSVDEYVAGLHCTYDLTDTLELGGYADYIWGDGFDGFAIGGSCILHF